MKWLYWRNGYWQKVLFCREYDQLHFRSFHYYLEHADREVRILHLHLGVVTRQSVGAEVGSSRIIRFLIVGLLKDEVQNVSLFVSAKFSFSPLLFKVG